MPATGFQERLLKIFQARRIGNLCSVCYHDQWSIAGPLAPLSPGAGGDRHAHLPRLWPHPSL